MQRDPILSLVALALAAYGVYTALYVPAMLVGPSMPLLLICFIVQVVCALAAGIGIWRRRGWAGTAVLLLGAAITATQIIEVLLGILPYLRAVLVSVLAIIAALVVAAYVNRAQPISRGG